MIIFARFQKFFFSTGEKYVLRRLVADFNSCRINYSESVTFVVEGIVSDMLVALLYIFVFLNMERKLKKRINIVLVTQRKRDKWLKVNRIYCQFFETRIISFKENLTKKEQVAILDDVANGIASIKTSSDLLNLKIDGVSMGPNIYSSYVRTLFTGTVKEINPNVQKEIKLGYTNFRSVKKLIYEYKPTMLFLTHTEYHTYGSLFKAFLVSDIPVVNLIPYAVGRVGGRVYRSLENYEKDPKNYVFSVTDDLFKKTKSSFSEVEDQKIISYFNNRYQGNDPNFNGDYHKRTQRFQNDELKNKLGILGTSRIALVATHLLWDDSTTSYHSLYPDYERWLAATLAVIKNNKNMTWLIKGHPSEYHMGTQRFVKEILQETYGDNMPENVIFIDGNADINTYSLLEIADVILTVRGTIGLEAAFKGKPIVTAGSGPYTNLGFTKEFESVEEYEQYLLRMDETEPKPLTEDQKRDARITCYAYFFLKAPHCISLSKGLELQHYKTFKVEEIFSDATLNRLVDDILLEKECDLV